MRLLDRFALPAYFWLFVAYLFLPLAIMAAVGFRDSNFVAFPIQAWTTRWYQTVIFERDVMSSIWVSVKVALGATVMSLVIGIPMAFFVARLRGFWRAVMIAIIVLPAFLPVVVAAISMRMFIGVLGLQTGIPAVIFGHAVSTVPFVVVMILTRFGSMSPNLADAARDLGADEFIVAYRVTLPYLMPAIFGGAVFSMLLSFEDFVRSFFLGGFEPTFPVLLFAKLRFGFDPGLAAISTMVLIVSVLVGLYAERFIRRRKLNSSSDIPALDNT
ncbi:ABC transporter permease [Mesorhizobium marinum]|uniref:ABC transporter permease n=1 Tax=Mesorhizobium marinum TaxID=3228790 RepID=A0ABV3R0E8_9HYPH